MRRSSRIAGRTSTLFAGALLIIGMDTGVAQGQAASAHQAEQASQAGPSSTWTPPPPTINRKAKQPKPKVVKPTAALPSPRTVTPKATLSTAPSVIVDTDMFGSADDAGAVAMANALQDNGKINLLGVVVNDPSRWGAPTVSAINTYYGHADIPVGAIKPVTNDVPTDNTFAKDVAQKFPNAFKGDGANAPDATTVYRQLLHDAPDHSVTIVGIGLETNLKNLMDSPADANGPAGIDLITSKVKSLTMMGGEFPNSYADGPEYNWVADSSAAMHVVNDWPKSVPATFEGYEVGQNVLTGAGLANTPDANPVKAAYAGAIGAGNSMSSWDAIAMYYTGMGLDGLFTESAPGTVVVESGGGNHFDEASGTQHYLINAAPEADIAAKLEALIDQQPGTTPPPTNDPIVTKYNGMGGASSFLGTAVGAETVYSNGGKGQAYQNGAIYWSSATGAHVVHGAFLAKYRQLGGPTGILGYPKMDEAAVGDGVGEYITFNRSSGATLYWTSRTGAHAVYGAILTEYRRFGGPVSTLGYPITDESSAVGGRYNHFSRASGASIYWSSRTGAHAIYGAIRSRWASMGWETSRLGFPTTNEYGYPGGRRNEFQHGTISWTRATGAITVRYW